MHFCSIICFGIECCKTTYISRPIFSIKIKHAKDINFFQLVGYLNLYQLLTEQKLHLSIPERGVNCPVLKLHQFEKIPEKKSNSTNLVLLSTPNAKNRNNLWNISPSLAILMPPHIVNAGLIITNSKHHKHLKLKFTSKMM